MWCVFEWTQHYAYKVVAQHITAVCFYAKNYSNDPSFSKWEEYLNEDRYCSKMEVPTLEELKKYLSEEYLYHKYGTKNTEPVWAFVLLLRYVLCFCYIEWSICIFDW